MAGSRRADLVLIVEDDARTAQLIALYLERDGFATLTAGDGEQALQLARSRSPAFIILDLMLPRLDGWEVCRQIRKFSEVPILMLTARGDEVDRVSGLMIGADDYLVKPFSPRELVARVKAILRRAQPREQESPKQISSGGLTLDIARHTVLLNGQPLSLTPSEFKLLKVLMSAPGRLFSREQLMDHLYPRREEVIDRVIDVHIGKLRQKLEKDPSDPKYILTVRGFGYKFAEVERDQGKRPSCDRDC
jgi:DNA-binding response OmpR family regulator